MNSENGNPVNSRKRRRYGLRELLLRSPLTIYRSRIGVRRVIQSDPDTSQR